MLSSESITKEPITLKLKFDVLIVFESTFSILPSTSFTLLSASIICTLFKKLSTRQMLSLKTPTEKDRFSRAYSSVLIFTSPGLSPFFINVKSSFLSELTFHCLHEIVKIREIKTS